jgi:hypothetical protein
MSESDLDNGAQNRNVAAVVRNFTTSIALGIARPFQQLNLINFLYSVGSQELLKHASASGKTNLLVLKYVEDSHVC